MTRQPSLTFTIHAGEAATSLGSCLLGRGLSQKLITRLKIKGGLAVNGQLHRMIDPVAEGDLVTIAWPPETTPPHLIPAPAPAVPVLYEDEYFIAFDKPADLAIHPCARHYHRSLGNYFAWRCPGLPYRPIGRLDRNTTGLCLTAKEPFCAAVANQNIEKLYFAWAEGHLPQNSGVIDLPLARVDGPTIRRQVDPAGQTAITSFQVLARLPAGSSHPGDRLHFSLLAVGLGTGRTHQIRAHFSHIGFPLAGDTLYGGHTAVLQRQALHCGALRLIHPVSRRPLFLYAPLPPDMARLLPEADQLIGRHLATEGWC